MTRYRFHLLVASLLACASVRGLSQFKADLVNLDGVAAPCVGIGPAGAPAVKVCSEMVQKQGFIRVGDVGASGLTIGATAKDDGVIVAIATDSPAAHAGLQVGDVIVAVAEKPVKPTPGTMAAKAVFGKRGETLHLKLRRGGSDLDVSLVRDAQNAPPGPKSPNMFFVVRSVISWRGQFIPCMGAGPLAIPAIDMCSNRFKPYGFVKTGEFGSTGFQLDLARQDKALVTTVDPASAGAKAGIQPGDEIVAVEGQPLTASTGEAAKQMLFGKAGDKFRVTVHRGQSDQTVELLLAASPKS